MNDTGIKKKLIHRKEYLCDVWDNLYKGTLICEADIIVKKIFRGKFRGKYGWRMKINFRDIEGERHDFTIRRSELAEPNKLMAKLYDEGFPFCDDPQEVCNYLLSYQFGDDDD